jgi:NAD(P)-dependent dehydrogenase (short-subunit alcohol dehydrogenase family)
MDLGLKGRVVVVTGGTSGIGLACVRMLLAEGADVALCARDVERLNRTRDELAKSFGPEHLLAHPCNIVKQDEVARFVDAIVSWRGRCDVLINNAGGGRFTKFADTPDDVWRQELELKFFGQIFPIRAFKPLLDRSEIAAILTVSSLLAYQPEPHMVCTSAARAGVQNLLKSLAEEFAPKIRVNSVIFGLIDSAQWQRRFEVRPWPNRNIFRSNVSERRRKPRAPSFFSPRRQRATLPARIWKSPAAYRASCEGNEWPSPTIRSDPPSTIPRCP